MYLTKLTVRGGLQMMIPIISLFPSGTKALLSNVLARLNGCFKNELSFLFSIQLSGKLSYKLSSLTLYRKFDGQKDVSFS